jgi:hypothetical protein
MTLADLNEHRLFTFLDLVGTDEFEESRAASKTGYQLSLVTR